MKRKGYVLFCSKLVKKEGLKKFRPIGGKITMENLRNVQHKQCSTKVQCDS